MEKADEFYYKLMNLLGDNDLSKDLVKEIRELKDSGLNYSYTEDTLTMTDKKGRVKVFIEILDNEIRFKKKRKNGETNKRVRIIDDENFICLHNVVSKIGSEINAETEVKYIFNGYEKAKAKEVRRYDKDNKLTYYNKKTDIRKDFGIISVESSSPEEDNYYFAEDDNWTSKSIISEKGEKIKLDKYKTEAFLSYKNPKYIEHIRRRSRFDSYVN